MFFYAFVLWEKNVKQKYLFFKHPAPHFLAEVWTSAALHILFPLFEKKKKV